MYGGQRRGNGEGGESCVRLREQADRAERRAEVLHPSLVLPIPRLVRRLAPPTPPPSQCLPLSRPLPFLAFPLSLILLSPPPPPSLSAQAHFAYTAAFPLHIPFLATLLLVLPFPAPPHPH